jgi:hypothetical protein
MKKLFFAFVILFFTLSLIAQRKMSAKVDGLLRLENYSDALVLIEAGLKKHPDYARFKVQKGICQLYGSQEYQQALSTLSQATQLLPLNGKTRRDGIEARFYYGKTLHLLEQFTEAKTLFESLRNTISPNDQLLLERINREWLLAYNAIELSKNPVSFRINNIGSTINSSFDEHSPLVSLDENMLFFTSNRRGSSNSRATDGKFFEDIYYSEYVNGQWQAPKLLNDEINSSGHNATASLSIDGSQLVIYQHNGISGDLYVSSLGVHGWSVPNLLPEPINSAFNETHGCFSADMQTFVFTSDRPGGFGGRDIYMVRQLPNGKWGKAQNLGVNINTAGNEESPFLHVDGKTLYFSSTEHRGMGGYDIFKSTYCDSMGWSLPVNIGYPINTPGDDLFYNPTFDGTRVYYASQRRGGEGGSDLFLIQLDESDFRTSTVVSGYIFNHDKQPFANVNITLHDVETGELVGQYKPSHIGKYVMIVPAGKKYLATYVAQNQTTQVAFFVNDRQMYESGNWAHYLEPIFLNE